MKMIGLVVVALGLIACGGGGSSTSGDNGSMAGMDAGSTSTAAGLDLKFVAGMVPHHQAAIDMAKVEIQKGKNPQVRALAQTIIDEQTREQAQMLAAASSHSWSLSMSMSPDQLMGQPIHMGMSQMAADVGGASDTDRTFLMLMITHHAMAVLMADTEAKSGTDAAMKLLATSIVAGQAKEIGLMQGLLVGSA